MPRSVGHIVHQCELYCELYEERKQ